MCKQVIYIKMYVDIYVAFADSYMCSQQTCNVGWASEQGYPWSTVLIHLMLMTRFDYGKL